MDKYIGNLFEERLASIPLWAWQRFLSLFTESESDEDTGRALDKLVHRLFRKVHKDRKYVNVSRRMEPDRMNHSSVSVH